MPIKIAPRASVSENFKGLIRSVIHDKLAKLHEEYERLRPNFRPSFARDNAGRIARLKLFLREEWMDECVTKLRSLPFTEYKVVGNNGAIYFLGVTKPVIADEYHGVKITRQWDIGVYKIYIPTTCIMNGSTNGMHFIPENEPKEITAFRDLPNGRYEFAPASKRHMHHIAHITPRSRQTGNPLDEEPATCQGSFANILSGVMADGDIPEAFRVAYTYVARYNAGSPLAGGIGDLPWAKEVK